MGLSTADGMKTMAMGSHTIKSNTEMGLTLATAGKGISLTGLPSVFALAGRL
jgi:hypothetical protein